MYCAKGCLSLHLYTHTNALSMLIGETLHMHMTHTLGGKLPIQHVALLEIVRIYISGRFVPFLFLRYLFGGEYFGNGGRGVEQYRHI